MASPPFLYVVVLTTIASLSAEAVVFPKEALPTNLGYLPIQPVNAFLFFAFYEATHQLMPLPATPLLLWLQGGPGCSALLSTFHQIGPCSVHRTNDGSGSSFLSPIPTDQSVIAGHVLAALRSFFSAHPGSRARPLFLAGESYAGKFVPAAGAHIRAASPALPERRRMNLRWPTPWRGSPCTPTRPTSGG